MLSYEGIPDQGKRGRVTQQHQAGAEDPTGAEGDTVRASGERADEEKERKEVGKD